MKNIFTPADANVGPVLFKILQETQSGKMTWASAIIAVGVDGNNEVPDGLAFSSSLHGTPIRIYRIYNSQYNTRRFIMELYSTQDGMIYWRFPENDNIIIDIYRSIEEKNSSIRGLFSNYLSE